MKAENINLVSPTIYIDKIINAVKCAREKGLHLPIIYNSNGYEKVESLKKLEGIIDVYLPDLKYANNEIAFKYSKVQNYFQTATSAIKEMERQVGAPKFNENGMIQKGLIVRHLIMPNHIENSKKVLKWIKENLSEKIYISVMTQYFPTYKASNYLEINRKITKEEYETIEEYINTLNIQNGYMQDFTQEDESKYVPKWQY
jgi:putative pyruvate formate lyase activating enzyme